MDHLSAEQAPRLMVPTFAEAAPFYLFLAAIGATLVIGVALLVGYASRPKGQKASSGVPEDSRQPTSAR